MAHQAAGVAAYSDLAAVVAAWPALPDAIRRAVVAIVRTATPGSPAALPNQTGGPSQALDDTLPPGYESKPRG